MTSFIRKNPVFSVLLTAGVILASAAAVLPEAPVWITDVGNKYIIMRNFEQTGKLAVAHPVPEAFPTGGFHFKKTPGGYRSFYPEILPVFSAPLFRTGGNGAVVLIPLLSGILLAGAVAYKFRSFTCAMLTLFAAPCAFYSLMLWEMIPAVLAGFCGVMLVRDKRFFSGGLLLGLGLFMREELYFLGASCGLVLLFQKEFRALLRIGAGFLCGMLPVWLVQYCLTGHVLGVHGATYYLNNRTGFDLKEEITGVFWNYYQHLFRFDTDSRLLIPLIRLLLCSFVKRAVPSLYPVPFREQSLVKEEEKTQKLKALLMIAGGCTFFPAGTFKFVSGGSFCYTAALSAGFISSLPLCWLFWANWKTLLFSGPWKNRFLAGTVIAYTLLVPPLLTRHDVGLFWGARHFLFIMPFAVFLALKALKVMPFQKILLWSLAAVSVIWQLCGLYALLRVSEEADRFSRIIQSTGAQVVASDVFFLPEQTPRLFFERDFCEVTTPRQWRAVRQYMKKKNQKELTFITSRRWSKLTPETRQILAQTTVPGKAFEFKSDASGFMDLIVIQLFLKERK